MWIALYLGAGIGLLGYEIARTRTRPVLTSPLDMVGTFVGLLLWPLLLVIVALLQLTAHLRACLRSRSGLIVDLKKSRA